MSDENMREEFEAAYVSWLVSTGWDKDSALLSLEISKNGDYFRTSAQGAWWGWQASRAALVIELPDCFETYGHSAETARVATDCCAEAIEAVGVRVKP